MAVVDDERALLGTWGLYPGAPAARPMVVTYSFITDPPAYEPELGGFVAADDALRGQARAVMDRVAAACGLVFVETTQHVGEIAFGRFDFGPGGGFSQTGTAAPPGNGTQPDAAGAPHVVRGYFPEHNNERWIGPGYVVSAIRVSPGEATEYVLLRQLLYALGMTRPLPGVPLPTPPPLAELSKLEAGALRQLYGPAGSSAWATEATWDAASETMTQTATRDGVYVRGTNATDIVRVTARHAVVVTLGGNDTIEAAGQSVEIDAGPGEDTVHTGLANTVSTQLWGGAGECEINAPGVRQIIVRAEHILFTNGIVNGATGRFEGELDLGVPAFVRWLDYHTDPSMTGQLGTISLSGPPGLKLEAYLNPTELTTGYPVDTTLDGRGVESGAPSGPYTPDAVAAAPLWVDAYSTINGVRTEQVLVAMYYTGTFGADVIDASGDPAARIHANTGDDSIIGSPGDDLIRGGAGTDTVTYPNPLAAYLIGEGNGILRVLGPQGDDILVGVERLAFADTGALTVASLRADGRIEGLMAVSRTNPLEPYADLGVVTRAGFELPRAYLGPVGWLEREFIGSLDRETVLGTARAEFIALLAADDAIDAAGGDDVLDGGLGSNFLTGGAGRDTFFLDGRGAGATWSTITDWADGEELALWGWRPGVSLASWGALDGAAGWQGATLYADLDGNGIADAVVTWTGRTRGGLPEPAESEGLLWFR